MAKKDFSEPIVSDGDYTIDVKRNKPTSIEVTLTGNATMTLLTASGVPLEKAKNKTESFGCGFAVASDQLTLRVENASGASITVEISDED